MSTSSSEITGLGVCIARADTEIDAALDRGDRRAFRVYCKRRASLVARRERALLAAATAEVPA